MNKEALYEMADYLDSGEFSGRKFDMGAYQDCVLGHCAARELERRGEEATVQAVGLNANGISIRAFGIRQSEQTEEWNFAFGAMWGSDPRAAAKRLRYLALHDGAPDRSVWDQYRSVTDKKAAAPHASGALRSVFNPREELVGTT